MTDARQDALDKLIADHFATDPDMEGWFLSEYVLIAVHSSPRMDRGTRYTRTYLGDDSAPHRTLGMLELTKSRVLKELYTPDEEEDEE